MHSTSKGLSRRAALPLLTLVTMVAACASWRGDGAVSESWDPSSTSEVQGVPVQDLRTAIERRLEGERPEGLDAGRWRHVQTLYARYDNAPLILERRGVGKRAESLVKVIAMADADGLERGRYKLPGLQPALRTARERGASADELADADVVLASVYALLAGDLLTGWIEPRSVSDDWRIDPRSADVDSMLARTLRFEPLDRAILHLRPRRDGYQALQLHLERYREIVAAGGWGPVPVGTTLRMGDTSTVERLTALKRRLVTEGYLSDDTVIAPLAADSSRAIYGAVLAGAVGTFQKRHSIGVDSVLGLETVTSLNVPAEYRLRQIAANLERHRWLPRDLGDRHILVNVPAFQLDAYDGGESVLDMRVIVGSEYRDRATPTFADSMSYIEFAPYWNVPENIANSEIWPRVHADPGYLSRNNYEIWDEGGVARIRQRPGPTNALGLVKFMFPNQYNIYLHHTPQEELFEADVRAFSHGCIRVEKPVELAEFVLANQGEWSQEEIREAMEGATRRVDLETKLPVFIVYFTAFDRDGVLHFGNDLYDNDGAIVHAVARGAMPSEESEQELDVLRREASSGGIRRVLSRIGL